MMHFSQNLSTNIVPKPSAMPPNTLSDRVTAPPTRHAPPPVQTNHINTAILASVRQAAIAFGAASEARHTLQDMARLLTDFAHFRRLCVSDLKHAFHEQRQAQAANRLAKTQGQASTPNRIVRNRKGTWETLFRYFARHTRLGRDVEIRAHGHQGDYLCELIDQKMRESEFDKGVRIFEKLGISRADMEALYVSTQAQALSALQHSMDGQMADQPEESTVDSTADSPDEAPATARESSAPQAASAPRDTIAPEPIASMVNDAPPMPPTTTPTSTAKPGKPNNLQPVCESTLQVLEQLAHSGSAMAAQARQLLDDARQTARRMPGNPTASAASGRHCVMQTARHISQGQSNRHQAHVFCRPQNGPAKEAKEIHGEMHGPDH